LQARAWFKANGVCIADWSKERGLNRDTVFDLLRGKIKGHRGAAHRAAIALGLKADPSAKRQAAAA